MKNRSLSFQIWLVFIAITLIITAFLAYILPRTLRGFFTKEIFSTIEASQNLVLNQSTIEDYWREENKSQLDSEDVRTVRHFLVYGDNRIVVNSPVSFQLLTQVKKDIRGQKDSRQEYSEIIDKDRVFYIISKIPSYGIDSYLVSYLGDSYREAMVKTLFKQLISVMLLISLLSWIPALLFSTYLSKPLVDLENRVEKLAERDWAEAIVVERGDEIGKLGSSVEKLRQELIRQDKAERSFLQNVSHELKTPVMVIRSYSQAIKDGIFPKGNLDDSIDVVDQEAERLESKIKNLLYFSKLSYIESLDLIKEEFFLDQLIEEVVDRLSWSRSNLDWKLSLEPTIIFADREQWTIILENILDNQIRYADKQISIDIKKLEDLISLTIANDGPKIEDSIKEHIFKEFKKGDSGEFGLGLTIVAKILNMHDCQIFLDNQEGLVAFNIIIPVKKDLTV